MAQVLHQRATTTHAIREDIQRSTESVATLSRRYGINPKTVRKWRSRTSVEVVRMGPKAARSTSLTRSSLHRLYQRHGTSQRPRAGEATREKKFFKHYPIGYLHIDISDVQTGEGKAYLFVSMDRTSKFVHAQLY